MNAVSQALLETLLARGLVSHDQFEIVLKQDPNSLQETEKRLLELGAITRLQIQQVLQDLDQREYIELSRVLVDSEVLCMVNESIAKKAMILPIAYQASNGVLKIAICERSNQIIIEQLQTKLGASIRLQTYVASESDLQEAIDRYYGYELSLEGIFEELEHGFKASNFDNEISHPIVRLVNAILVDAVKKRASDIHFEPERYFIRIRYRIDGVMQQIRLIHISYWQAILIRIKVISHMDIAESRDAQDGRLQMQILSKNIDFRVASHPTLFGENLVMRILDRDKVSISLSKIELRENLRQQLYLLLQKTQGMVLVTGPTGSGKTTMLHAMLNHLNNSQVNIMTLEDPVEYQLSLVRQTSLNELVKLDFASGIRSILRQDPDIILVGEIRDEETAKMAFRAAMTGHLVFSTLHANSILGVIPRLKDMGMSIDTIVDNLNGVIAQRLVRVLCDCKETDQENNEKLKRWINLSEINVYKPKGCDKCLYTGYFGRILIIEYLELNSQLKKLLDKRMDASEIFTSIRQFEHISMWQDGLRRVAEGYTTIDEVMRVVNVDQDIHLNENVSI